MMAASERRHITVLLVDVHAVVREGYRRVLDKHADIEVVGECGDITLPGMSGIESMRRMLEVSPGARVLIFSVHEEAIFAKRAMQAGAFGYVTKASAPNVLVEAVRLVAGGQKYLSVGIARVLALQSVDADVGAA